MSVTALLAAFGTRWEEVSPALFLKSELHSIVTFYNKYTRSLTFENVSKDLSTPLPSPPPASSSEARSLRWVRRSSRLHELLVPTRYTDNTLTYTHTPACTCSLWYSRRAQVKGN